MIRKPQPKGSASTGISSQVEPGHVHFMANRLRPYFAPASMLPPPGIPRGATGNRNVACTSGQSPNYQPSDSAVVQLKAPGGGASASYAVYRFTQQFKHPPIISAIALSANMTAPTEITLSGLLSKSNKGVVIQSADNTDTRWLHVTALGNPD